MKFAQIITLFAGVTAAFAAQASEKNPAPQKASSDASEKIVLGVLVPVKRTMKVNLETCEKNFKPYGEGAWAAGCEIKLFAEHIGDQELKGGTPSTDRSMSLGDGIPKYTIGLYSDLRGYSISVYPFISEPPSKPVSFAEAKPYIEEFLKQHLPSRVITKYALTLKPPIAQ